jgi:hypothetical protein
MSVRYDDSPGVRHQDEPTLGECFSNLTRQASELIHEEVELAKTEITRGASRMGKGAVMLAGAAAVGYAGLLALVATCIILLALVVKLWIAALIITALVLAVAGFLAMTGLKQVKAAQLAPKQTMQTIQEDVRWAKAQTK